jgi:hypothetical protein
MRSFIGDFFMFIQYNISAILVCAVLNMVLGFIWYGFLFSTAFIQLMGITPEHMSDPASQKAAVHGYFASFLSSVMMAIILSYFIIFTSTTTVLEGLKLGLLSWLGFTVTTMLPTHYFSMKPLKLALINIAYPMVGLSLMGMILAFWRK